MTRDYCRLPLSRASSPARNSRLTIFPVTVNGNSYRNSISRGASCAANRVFTWVWISLDHLLRGSEPGRSLTNALIV